jgi:hypothetical protein
MVYYGDHKVRMSNGKKTEALSPAEAGRSARLRAITEAKGTAYNAATAQPVTAEDPWSGAKTLTI